jgi:hypothetical protein
MKLAKLYFNLLACLLILAAGKTVSAQEVGTANPASGCDTVNGTRFNLESRVNAVPQNSESVDFMLSRVSSGVDLVVGAANDNRGNFQGFKGFPVLGRDTYFVHRTGSNCAAEFEGSLSTISLGTPTVVADRARDAFFLSDLLSSSGSLLVEVARTTATNLLSPAACPDGTQDAGQTAKCWPVVGVANFTPNGRVQAALLRPHIAVDPRTSGIGAGDVYVACQFIDGTNFPAIANVQIIACNNLSVNCGSPVVASGTDTFGSFPYIQVRSDGTITVSYWTYTQPNDGHQPNPIDIKFVTCTPQGAPKPPVCSTPARVATSKVPAGFAPAGNGFLDTLFPKHANRLEADGKTVTTFLIYDRCRSIIGKQSAAEPCSKVDVVLATSTDNGATWTTPRLVSTAAGHQYMGAIHTDASTNITSIAYYSTQHDTFEQRVQLFLNQIQANSTTVGPGSILTSAANDPSSGIADLTEPGAQGVVDYGDRIGIAAAGTGSKGQSRLYVHYTWNNVAGISNGVPQPDPNNTLVVFPY